jgi:hypothetical protein
MTDPRYTDPWYSDPPPDTGLPQGDSISGRFRPSLNETAASVLTEGRGGAALTFCGNQMTVSAFMVWPFHPPQRERPKRTVALGLSRSGVDSPLFMSKLSRPLPVGTGNDGYCNHTGSPLFCVTRFCPRGSA